MLDAVVATTFEHVERAADVGVDVGMRILERVWPMIAVKAGRGLATPELIDAIIPSVRKLHAHWLPHRRTPPVGMVDGN